MSQSGATLFSELFGQNTIPKISIITVDETFGFKMRAIVDDCFAQSRNSLRTTFLKSFSVDSRVLLRSEHIAARKSCGPSNASQNCHMALSSGFSHRKNLACVFAGETVARTRYTFFASKAKKYGYEQNIRGLPGNGGERKRAHETVSQTD
jgi:hypothetical protein